MPLCIAVSENKMELFNMITKVMNDNERDLYITVRVTKILSHI